MMKVRWAGGEDTRGLIAVVDPRGGAGVRAFEPQSSDAQGGGRSAV